MHWCIVSHLGQQKHRNQILGQKADQSYVVIIDSDLDLMNIFPDASTW